jgi:preprotein translocase subunit SecG
VDTNSYLSFLLIGILLAVIDGQIIYRSGARYLEGNRGNPEAASAMTVLATALFHVVVLGALALLSTVRFPGGSSFPAVMGRLGVYLLILALAHAITIAVLAQRREEQVVEDWNARAAAEPRQPADQLEQELREPTVTPVPGQEGRRPHVSPNLEHEGPYRSGGTPL